MNVRGIKVYCVRDDLNIKLNKGGNNQNDDDCAHTDDKVLCQQNNNKPVHSAGMGTIKLHLIPSKCTKC